MKPHFPAVDNALKERFEKQRQRALSDGASYEGENEETIITWLQEIGHSIGVFEIEEAQEVFDDWKDNDKVILVIPFKEAKDMELVPQDTRRWVLSELAGIWDKRDEAKKAREERKSSESLIEIAKRNWSRIEQPKFRRDLFETYGCCLITGCTTKIALDAAHIRPHSKDGTATVENGLLLRSDIHKLFDFQCWTIRPDDFCVEIAPGWDVADYPDLREGKIVEQLKRTDELMANLQWRHERFRDKHSQM